MQGHSGLCFKQLNQYWSRKTWNSNLKRARRFPIGTKVDSVAAQIEFLEQRTFLSASGILGTLVAEPTFTLVRPAATTGPTGYSPSQIQSAYGFNQVAFSNGVNGTGQTIAIVDAYGDPTIQSDLQAFDKAYGLANPPSLTVVSQTGSTTSLPQSDPAKGWELEEALDVEWAHALAPGAKIVLVEANSSSYSDLFTAVATAANLPGVSVVSMSWGGGEFSSESSYDSLFTTPAGHQGVTFVASTGDSGAPGGFPAYSPNVLAVGGTTLNLGASGNYVSESGWTDGGGGISLYESQPAYQHGVVTQSTTKRAIPDVSFDADPSSGVGVYDTFTNGSTSPWSQVGGTSFSAPSWGAIISIINQGRAQSGLASLNGATQTLPMLYHLDTTNPAAFHDITTGNNGYAAGKGYDLVTGLGSPVVNILVPGMDGSTSNVSKLVFQQMPTAGIAGQALSPVVTVAIENSSGQIVTSDNSTVTLSIANGPGGFASGSTFTVNAVNGIATFSKLILDTSGSYTISANDGSLLGGTSPGLSISSAAAAKVVFQQVPTGGTIGQILATISVAIEDAFGNLVTGNTSKVTMTVASGPGTFTTGSTTSVAAVNGVATFTNLVLSTSGSYTLHASDASLTGATSNSITVGAALSAPQNVGLIALSPTSAQLTWSTTSGAQGYRVYQVIGSQTVLLGTVNSTTSSSQINGLTAGSTVSFKVEAFNATSVADSKVVSITLPAIKLNTPVLTAVVLTSSTAQLNWSAVSGTQGYRIYCSIGNQRYLLSTLNSGATSVKVIGLVAGTTYQFQVEAFQGSTVKDSNLVSVNSATHQVQTVCNTAIAMAVPAGYAFDNRGSVCS